VPAIAWAPAVDTSIVTIVRPVPWARAVGDLRFDAERWGDRLIRISSPGGLHLIVRRHGSPDLALWLPTELSPAPGGTFGLYLHPDQGFAERVRAASTFRRAVGLGPPLRPTPFAHAHRHAAMLYIYDQMQAGATLRDVAEQLFEPMPADWRSSSERSDLRRLADAADQMVAGEYRRLLASRSGP
jgi:hypothetical protein